MKLPLPELPPALALCAALTVAMRAGLISRSALDPLQGRILRLEADGIGFGVKVTLWKNAFYPAFGSPDVTIRAAPRDYLSLALRREDPDTLFFTRRLVMEGDTDLGLTVKNALDAVDWDALPAPLARLSARLAGR